MGVRLFNAGGASIKLALSGYYQKAFDQLRDIVEVSFLLDYLQTYPEKISAWMAAGKRQRMTEFGPGFIRRALDKRDNFTGEMRKQTYDLLSEKASHASYGGFILVASGEKNLVNVGPFFEQKKLSAWLSEMALRLPHAALHLTADPKGVDWPLMATRGQYLEKISKWHSTYLANSNNPDVEKAPE